MIQWGSPEVEFRRLLDLYRDMLSIANSQVECVLQQEFNEGILQDFGVLLDYRQTIMDEIEAVEARLENLFKKVDVTDTDGDNIITELIQDESVRPWLKDTRVSAAIEAIQAKDEACQRLLQEKYRQLDHKMRGVRQNRRAFTAYQEDYSSSEARFFDQKK